MSRYRPRESTLKEKRMNPVWRGVGCIFLVLMTVGGFWLAGYLIDLNLFPMPNLDIEVGRLFTIPGRLVLQLIATGFVDAIVYGMLTVVYALINPPRPGPLDAPPVRPRGPRNLSR